jgi:acetyl-CoA carboxylase biotin carboxyl carrier protein
MSKAKAPVRKGKDDKKDEKKKVSSASSRAEGSCGCHDVDDACCCGDACSCNEPLCALGPEELATVRELAEIATEFDLAELNVDPCGGIRVVRRVSGAAAAPVVSAPSLSAPVAVIAEKKAEKSAETGVLLTSPFVGTFYRAPAPEAPPFVEAGQAVRKGQVVCIVEAMKLMNEIESEFDGKIVEILAKNAEHVEYGQPLFRIEKA